MDVSASSPRNTVDISESLKSILEVADTKTNVAITINWFNNPYHVVVQGKSVHSAILEGGQLMSEKIEVHADESAQVHVGDKTNVGTAGVVMGPGSQAGNISVQGSANVASTNLSQLADELGRLRAEMKRSAGGDGEHDIEVGHVAQAEKAAKEGNQSAALGHLRNVGEWCLESAKKIGVNVASAWIQNAINFD
jgi:hypothetical protein